VWPFLLVAVPQRHPSTFGRNRWRVLDMPGARGLVARHELRDMYLADVFRRTARELRGIVRAETPAHGRLRDHLVVLAVVTVGVDLVCAGLALLFERDAPHTEISSFGTAVFWTSTQLLTVSSSIQNPLTTGGRILDVFMELYAISVVATLAGSMGSFMVKRGREMEHAAGQAAKA
jgi:hypothetical protein